MSEDETIADLQSRIAELERELETLNGVVTDQAKTIAAMEKRMATLIERFLAVEEQAGGDVPIDKPPHW
ncbi:SlyX family protein [Notoacmeibacter sp. MSK16QG-6]|uniref:SlyX family protein n=1 Tax=Notoacmeibacter sp. MSK16QG-6 TaxID=2957982 RepID=UPI00209F8EC1|nr:SlyX family protein [Notoacmeibacter sp. MSK16QG-6]MCP1198962.1 SlyX family protein [Notoacmeibacter sp. MSK16QG-6]